MIKKLLCTVTFIALVLGMTGCSSKAPEKASAPAEKVDYVVVEAPATAREGVKDPTTGFVKINPKFDGSKLPQATNNAPKWFKNGLGSKIPAIDNGNILEVVNNDNQFLAYVANIDEQKFENYRQKFLRQGYQYGKSTSWESLELRNDQYEVNLRFSQDGDKITTIRAKILNSNPQK